MKITVKVLADFTEPNGTRHETGEVVELDDRIVFDLEYLILGGTVEIQPKPTKPSPYKPPMETKGADQ